MQFREETIQIDNKTISVVKKDVKDIFKFGDKPYLVVASSGSGKSCLAIDIIFKFAKEASKIYYITATKESIDEDDLAKIPNVFKRDPTFESLYNIWREVISSNDAAGRPVNKLIELMSRIYPREELAKINQELVAYEKKIRSTEVFTEEDILAWKIEVIVREIFNGVAQYGTSTLKEEDMNILKCIISGKQKTLLLIDDVSAELQEMANNKTPVVYNGKQTKLAIAYKMMLIDMMTRIRHYNSIMVMFVHNWDTIDVRDKVDNFIVLDPVSAEGINRFRTIPESTRQAVIEGAKLIFGKYKYHFLVVKNAGNDVCVSKADLHDNDTLEVDPLNRKWIEVYDAIMKNLDVPTSNAEKNVDELI